MSARRIAMTAMLKDDADAIRAYVLDHRQIWPEIIADARAAGVDRTFIYRDGRRLFMFMDVGADFDLSTYAEDLGSPRTREWQARMDTRLEDQPDSAPGLKWRQLEEIGASEA